jgi:hypothetical protein
MPAHRQRLLRAVVAQRAEHVRGKRPALAGLHGQRLGVLQQLRLVGDNHVLLRIIEPHLRQVQRRGENAVLMPVADDQQPAVGVKHPRALDGLGHLGGVVDGELVGDVLLEDHGRIDGAEADLDDSARRGRRDLRHRGRQQRSKGRPPKQRDPRSDRLLLDAGTDTMFPAPDAALVIALAGRPRTRMLPCRHCSERVGVKKIAARAPREK